MSAAHQLSANTPKLTLGNKLIDIVEAAVVETFRQFFGVEAKLASCNYAIGSVPEREVTGVIGFVQESLEGTMSIGFSRDMIYRTLGPFYGRSYTDLNDEILQGVGEITNTVFGLTKAAYNAEGSQYQLCLPVVMVGESYFVYSYQPMDIVRMEFTSPNGSFWVEIFRVQ
jgi:chemotaxis protein CheX